MLTKAAITLTPKLGTKPPEVFVSVPGQVVQKTLWQTQRVELEFDAPVGWIEIVFMNKPDNDPDMAVIIDRVEFFGISDPKFVWAGVYTPKYPEPWYSQQTEKPSAKLCQQNYMGWNGCWRLDFDVPVFTWIHRTLNLGWIYQ
jgi:sulfur carrier protein ThiS